MDTNELLLAAAVREVAIELRKKAAALEARSGTRIEGETFDSFHARFAANHPLTEYAGEALDELHAIAKAMRS